MRIGLDIETTGLDPRTDRIVLVALAFPDGRIVVGPPTDLRPLLVQVWQEELVCHNAMFDLTRLCWSLKLPPPRSVVCTMTAEFLRSGGDGRDLSLAALAERELGIVVAKELQTSFREGTGLTPEQVAYVARDAQLALELSTRLDQKVLEEGLDRVWALERQVFPLFLEMVVWGIPFDRERLQALLAQQQAEAWALAGLVAERLGPLAAAEKRRRYEAAIQALQAWEAELAAERERAAQTFQDDPHAAPFPVDDWLLAHPKTYLRKWEQWWRATHPRPPKPVPPDPFNPDSPEQVRWALQELGIPVDSTATPVLKGLVVDPQIRVTYLEPLLRYRKVQKLVTAFGEGWLEAIWEDGCLHPEIRPLGTVTGRPTSRNPNLLQLPADPLFRSLVRAPAGQVVVAADYAQMELRILAELSGDPAMVRAFQEGIDLHGETARLLFGTVGDRERKVAKAINFLTVYGGGAQKLQAVVAALGIRLELEEARQILAKWRAVHAQAWQTLEGWREQGVQTGQIRDWVGRVRYLSPDDWTEAGNFPIQAANAAITKRAMVLADQGLKPLGGRLLLQVYDELVALAPEPVAERAATVLREAMVAAAQELLHQVPAAVDVAWGESWAAKG